MTAKTRQGREANKTFWEHEIKRAIQRVYESGADDALYDAEMRVRQWLDDQTNVPAETLIDAVRGVER